MNDEHYLKRELYDLMRTDPAIFDFLERGSLDGVWYWDVTEPANEWMSPRFKELFGYEDHEVPDESSWWMGRIHPDDLAIALENFEKHRVDPDHPYDQVVRYEHKDGSTVWVRCRGVAVRNQDGEAVRLLGCHNDITALKNAEAELANRNEELRDALRIAQIANDELERFAGSVAHDLRNPLTVVQGFAQLLQDRVEDEESATFAASIVRSVDRSLTMVSDLLAFATTVGADAEVELVELRPVLAWVMSTLEADLIASDASVHIDTDLVVHSWPSAMRQILLNLVENAIKYRHPERPLELHISDSTDAVETAEIRIEDNGIGIPAADREAIFKLGARVGGRATDHVSGSGVGLATCHALIQRLGGTIHAETGPEGIGTSMVITLPTHRSRSATGQRTVMMVDDDPDALALAGVVLAQIDIAVVAAERSASAAIDAYRRLSPPPHLVIIDLDLGEGATGIDVVRNILAIEPSQLVVVRSARLDDAAVVHARSLGVAGCYPKQSIDDLRAIAERFCR